MPRARPRTPLSARLRAADRSAAPEKRARARRWCSIPLSAHGARCGSRSALQPLWPALVAGWIYSRRPRGADRQGHDRARRFHQHDRRSGVRRHAATRTRGAAAAIAIPQPGIGRPDATNAGADGPATGCASDARYRAGRLRADRERRGGGRIDRQPRQSVRRRIARQELQHRRRARGRAGAGRAKGRCPRRAESDCDPVPYARRRIARHDRETLDAARGSDDAVARGLDGLQQRDESARSSGRRVPSSSSSVRSRSTRTSPSRMPGSGSATAASERPSRRGRAYSSLPVARSSQRRRAVLHRHAVRPATSPAIWNGSSRRWSHGRRPIRAIRSLTDCCQGWLPGAPANISCRSTLPTGASRSIPISRPRSRQEGLRRAPFESPGRCRGHHPSSDRSASSRTTTFS